MDKYIIKDKVYMVEAGMELIANPKKSRYYQDCLRSSRIEVDDVDQLMSEWACSKYIQFTEIYTAIFEKVVDGIRVWDNPKYILNKVKNDDSSYCFTLDFGQLVNDVELEPYLYSKFQFMEYENSIDTLFEKDDRHKCPLCEAYSYTEYIDHIHYAKYEDPICPVCLVH
jgi:hypothetical protein